MAIIHEVREGDSYRWTDRPDRDIDTWEFRKRHEMKRPILIGNIATGETGIEIFWKIVHEELGTNVVAFANTYMIDVNGSYKATLKAHQIPCLSKFSRWVGSSEIIDVLFNKQTGELYSVWIDAPYLDEQHVSHIYKNIVGDDSFFDEQVKQNKWVDGSGTIQWQPLTLETSTHMLDVPALRSALQRIRRLGDILKDARQNESVKALHDELKDIIEENTRRLAEFETKRQTVLAKEVKKAVIKDERVKECLTSEEQQD